MDGLSYPLEAETAAVTPGAAAVMSDGLQLHTCDAMPTRQLGNSFCSSSKTQQNTCWCCQAEKNRLRFVMAADIDTWTSRKLKHGFMTSGAGGGNSSA